MQEFVLVSTVEMKGDQSLYRRVPRSLIAFAKPMLDLEVDGLIQLPNCGPIYSTRTLDLDRILEFIRGVADVGAWLSAMCPRDHLLLLWSAHHLGFYQPICKKSFYLRLGD